MDSPSFDLPPDSRDVATSSTSKPRRSPWLAWLAIALTVGIAAWPRDRGAKDDDGEPSIVVPELQAKALVGTSTLSPSAKSGLQEQIQTAFMHGPLLQQLIGTVLTSEIVDPKTALKSLDEIETRIESGSLTQSDRDRELVELLRKTFDARIDLNRSLSEEDRNACDKLFPERLGWVGRLALLPVGTLDQTARSRLFDQARRVLFVLFGVLGMAFVAGVIGVMLQIVWWVFAVTGRLTCGIQTLRGDHVIYAETFAVWMALYLVLCLLIARTSLSNFGLITVLIPQIGGLAALAWPVMRGLRWCDVREDIGLKLGRNAWTAPFIGLGAYLSALPFVGVALIITLVMMQVANQFAGAGNSLGPTAHPIVGPILQGSWTLRLQLLFVAVFAAVPEEIMFRGVLYRHFREAGSKFGYIGSVLFAAFISSFVFAAIHPQGLFGIPTLMSVAIVFAIVREWRGSLVPSMVAHALVNAGTSSILFLIAD